MEDWEEYVCSGKSIAEKMLVNEESFISEKKNSSKEIFESLERSINQIKRRAERVSSKDEMLLLQTRKDLEYYEIIKEQLVEGLEDPKFTCLGSGAVFLSRPKN